jgi:hypothetical protein
MAIPAATVQTTPEFLLFVTSETLTDNSKVYNVVFGEHKFAAVTQQDARDIANAICDAINDHTTQTADVIDETEDDDED